MGEGRGSHIDIKQISTTSLLLDIHLEKTIIQKDTCTPMFTAALFTIARIWKQHKYSLLDEWIKIWHIYSTEYLLSVQSLNRVQRFPTPWTAAHQAPLSSTISQSLLQFTSIESVMLSNHFILCRPPSPFALNISQ